MRIGISKPSWAAVSLMLIAGPTSAARSEPTTSMPGPPVVQATIDPDAECLAAVKPGLDVLRALSRLLTPHEKWAERSGSQAVAYYLGALTARYRDPARIDREVAAAMDSYRDRRRARSRKAAECEEQALERLGALDDDFPIWRVNRLLGEGRDSKPVQD